ncbi:MAG: diguanylate cyclase [Bacteroidota bacterium]
MTDARGLNAFRSWIRALSLIQELSVLAGVILFSVGIFAGGTVIKLLAFLLGSGLMSYVIVSSRKGTDQETDRTSSGTSGEQEIPANPKKLVFDDFQDAKSRYRVGIVEEPLEDHPTSSQSESTRMAEPEPVRGPEPRNLEFNISDFFDMKDEESGKETGPRNEFSFLVKKVLGVIKEVNFAHTVALFWVDKEKGQLVLESFVSDSSKFTTHRRRELGTDLVSQVALTGMPQMINNVNALSQAETLPYYEGPEHVKTFVGVPIFYSRKQAKPHDPVAVLAIDCPGEDAYGPETLALLGQFTKMISALIQSYTDKYDLLLDSEVLRSITRFRDQLKLDFGTHNIVRSLADEASRLIPWDYISVVLFDEGRKAWVVQHIMNRMNDPYISVMSEVDPHQSIVGDVIQTSLPRTVDNIEQLNAPRFYQAERCESKGSMIVIPLNSLSRCYGAMVVENKDPKTYSDADVKLLQKVAETSSWALEILGLTDVANNYVSLDETTGVATRKHFLGRVQEEVQRANDFGAEISVVMISIDAMNEHLSRYGREAFDFVLQNIGRMIKSSIRPYDLVGRFDFNRFSVMLVNTTPNEASLWAEKLRKNVASNVINVETKSFSVTISVGVSGAATETSDVELLENADRVLQKAVEAGGNIVRVF